MQNKQIKELKKEAREKLADYVSIYFDCIWDQELLNDSTEDKGDKQCQYKTVVQIK
ncbi:MAG: hypothetical protein IMF19_04705 [Proteobacteria bacterium]|nr:hypothetical protein [Pseudomonadota bacterium]